MIAEILYRGRNMIEPFPKNSYQLYDFADKLRNELPFIVRISDYFKYESIDNEIRIETWDDLERFNLLAERMESIDDTENAKMFALMKSYPKASVLELLEMTYGLDSLTACECCDYDELAELVFDNDWLDVFADCPYEIFELLDKEKVAEEVISQRNGYMYSGYYIETDDFISPNINVELPKKEEGFFRLRLAADRDGRISKNRAEWLTLPCSKDQIDELEHRHDSEITGMICLSAESSLPMLAPYTITQADISEVNKLAEQLEKLNKEDFIKLKAVMEMGEVNGIEWTLDVIRHLDEFDFDPNPYDESVFGKLYLYNNLPQGFDTEIFAGADLRDFGSSILVSKGGMVTSYGVLSGQGQELYTSVFSEHEPTEDEETEMVF